MRLLLRRLSRESPGLLALGVATAAGQAAMLLPIALVIRRIFDTDIEKGDSTAIVWHGLLILVLYCATAALGYVSRIAVLGAVLDAAAKLRADLLAKIQDLSQAWHDRQRAGLLQSLLVQDTQRVEEGLRDLANPFLPAVLVAAALVVVAVVLSPVLFLGLLVVLPVSTAFAYVLNRRTKARARAWLESSRRFSSEVQTALRATTLTKIHGGERDAVRHAAGEARVLAHDARALEIARAGTFGVQAGVGAVAGSVILIVGGVAVARHSLSLGDLLAFYAVLGLLIRQLHTVGMTTATTTLGAESLVRLEQLLTTPPDDPYGSGTRKLDLRGGIALDEVTFAYSDEPVLSSIDMAIAPSEHVAIIGPNGAGKSTLVALIVGLYRPQSGRLLADGVPFDELDIRHFRRQIGVVLQDPVLFPGSIRSNIAFGRPDATDAEIRAAAAVATAAGFIEGLHDGYDTVVGDEGVGLSGGQRQRVAIARALLGEPALLLLDEPTTYLDEAAAAALLANLNELPRAPTVVIVTHDPQAAGHAERTIALRDGRLASDSAAAPIA